MLGVIGAAALMAVGCKRGKSAKEWHDEGYILAKAGRYAEALKCLNKAIDKKPDYAGALYLKGHVLKKQGQHEEALVSYELAVKHDPKLTPAWLEMGVLLRELKRWDKAHNCFDEVIKIDDSDGFAWFEKGVAFGRQGKWEKAIECYDRARECGNIHPKPCLLNKCLALRELGRAKAAEACFAELEEF